MSLTIIAAVSENNVIGANGKLPWRIPEDMQRFRELTLNHTVVMGRKTYESIPAKFRPLPQRRNIVLSSSMVSNDGIYVAHSIDEALEMTEGRESYVIGGAEIYKLFLPISDKMELTRVHREYQGDAFFPEVEWSEWNPINDSGILTSGNEQIPYSFLSFKRVFQGKRMIVRK